MTPFYLDLLHLDRFVTLAFNISKASTKDLLSAKFLILI